jgi:hypothetical protein
MLCRELIAVCSEIHTKQVNTVCGQNVEFMNVKPGGAYSKYRALELSINKYFCPHVCVPCYRKNERCCITHQQAVDLILVHFAN